MINLKALPRCGRIGLVAGCMVFALCAATARAQTTVTLGFNSPTNPPIGRIIRLPWNEQGFTVDHTSATGTAGILFGTPIAPPPYSGVLFLGSVSNDISTVTITSDPAVPFNLVSLELVGNTDVQILPGDIFHAVVTTSAGGSLGLPHQTINSTVTFGGPQWQNLSYVQFEFNSNAGLLGQPVRFELDNIVLEVPEPSMLLPGILAAGLLLMRRRKKPGT